MERGIVAQAPLGAIPRAQLAALLLRDAIKADEPDLLLVEAEKQLWLSWCSVRRVLAERAGQIPTAGRGRVA